MNSLDIDKIKGYLTEKHQRREKNMRHNTITSSGLKYNKFNLARNNNSQNKNKILYNKSKINSESNTLNKIDEYIYNVNNININSNNKINENNYSYNKKEIRLSKLLKSHINLIKYEDYLLSDEYINIIENLVKINNNLKNELISNLINIIDKTEIHINKNIQNIINCIKNNVLDVQYFLNINNCLEKLNDDLYYEMIKHTTDKGFYLSLKINIIISNHFILNILPIIKKHIFNIPNEKQELIYFKQQCYYNNDLLSFLIYEKLIQNLILFNRNNDFNYNDENINNNFILELKRFDRKYVYNTLIYNLGYFSVLDEIAMKRSQFIPIIENIFKNNLPQLISNTNNIIFIFISLLDKFNNNNLKIQNNNTKDLNINNVKNNVKKSIIVSV